MDVWHVEVRVKGRVSLKIINASGCNVLLSDKNSFVCVCVYLSE